MKTVVITSNQYSPKITSLLGEVAACIGFVVFVVVALLI